jgi:hypothetical protein
MIAATKEAPKATDLADKDRLYALDEPLREAVIWASLLDKVVEGMSRLPSMSRREVNIAEGELNCVNDALKEAIKRLDAGSRLCRH